ncbi:MAG: (d)CMP kinase [Puniceicoccales bacterium]|jgi:cytidylate kinase|nr:(d)CMP kinase [Puniceicoccales bacterium]
MHSTTKTRLFSFALLAIILTFPRYAHCEVGREIFPSDDKIIVTIDGGSATKKSPIARALAKKFNLVYVETGALYRTIAHVLIQAGIMPESKNESKVDEFLKDAKCECFLKNWKAKFSVNGVHLTSKELRAEDINANVAKYSSLFKSISDFCIKHIQEVVNLRKIQKFNGIVVEGRTCGTYIFPEADVKFWFLATDLAKIDFRLNVEKEIDNPVERDMLDFSRAFHPMVKPEHAIEVWTSSRSMEGNIALVSAFVEQKLDVKKHSKPRASKVMPPHHR